jgi:hypothetical protein
MDQVMALTPARRPFAARPDATLVASFERLSLGRRDDATRSAQFHHHRLGVEQHAPNRAVARQPLDRLHCYRRTLLDLTGWSAGQLKQGLGCDRDVDVRRPTT